MGTNVFEIIDDSLKMVHYIPSKDDLDKELVKEIRNYYSQDDEFKLTNLGVADSLNDEYLAYRTKIAELKSARDTRLTESETILSLTEEVDFLDGDDLRRIRVFKQ